MSDPNEIPEAQKPYAQAAAQVATHVADRTGERIIAVVLQVDEKGDPIVGAIGAADQGLTPALVGHALIEHAATIASRLESTR